MTAGVLDQITNAFVTALQSGLGAVQQFSIPLLAVFAIIAFYVHVGPLVMSGIALGDAVGSVLLTVLKAGIFYWLLVNLAPMTTAAFQTFLQWGIAPTGGGVSAQTFLQPSKILDLGFRAAAPIQVFIQSFTGWAAVWNQFVIFGFTLAYWMIIGAFAFVSLHLMMTIIEFHFGVLVGAILIPWGILQPTAFLTEFSIGWISGGLIRILITAAMLAIGVPLFDLLAFATTSGGDPSIYSSMVMALTSGMFAWLSWIIPGRAATIAGRGMAIGIHGGTILAGAAGGIRSVMTFTSTIRGVSGLLRR